jgi:uncharacterized membrane protein
MEENVEGALCYILGWVSGLVFLLLEKESKFVKFHATQSLATFLGLSVITIFLMTIPVTGWIFIPLIGLLELILWIILMLKAYQGEKYKLPIVGEFVEKQMNK